MYHHLHGTTVQLATACCLNKWTLVDSLQLDRPTCVLANHTLAFTPQCSTIFRTPFAKTKVWWWTHEAAWFGWLCRQVAE